MADLVFEEAGFQKLPSKVGPNNGFDGVYVKYGPNGEIVDLVINESKFSSATNAADDYTGKYSLGKTVQGYIQMSTEWINMNIDKMLKSKDPKVVETGEVLDMNRAQIRKEINVVTPDGKNKTIQIQ